MRERVCRCGETFRYPIGPGRDRVHCSSACRDRAKVETRARIRREASVQCSTLGCAGLVVFRVDAGLCEACYCFLRRTGRAREPKRQPKLSLTKGGYHKRFIPGHPLADGSGMVFEHRAVLHGEIGPGPHPCHWCGGGPLHWEDIVVDHLNEMKTDNTPSNLVASCNDCNRARGAMLPFLRSLQPSRLEQVLSLIRGQVERVQTLITPPATNRAHRGISRFQAG